MNKNFIKLTGGLIIAVIFLIILFLFASLGFTAAWLHTYKVFTKEKLVAEIVVSEEKKDGNGKYFNLVYKPVDDKSALVKVFDRSTDEVGELGGHREYKLYGDQFEIGGQVIKLSNFATLLGFDTIYKVARLEGDYADANEAQNVEIRSVEELNGGVDDGWKYLEKNEDNLGFFVDTVYGSYATKFIQDEEQTFGLYITEDGFILEKLKSIED